VLVDGGERPLSAGGGWQGFELLEGGGELGCPWPVVLQSQPSAAAMEREPGGDVQQPVAQPLGSALASSPESSSAWVQTIRSCASITISSHTSLRANSLNGNLASPVSLSSRMRSSTWACWRWRHSMIAMSSSGWSVRIAWKRWPSWSVNDS